MKVNKKVIIIGGGIAGAASALFLKKIGMDSEIYEIRSAAETIGGGLNLAPNGMSVLSEIGLDKEIIKKGCIIHDGIFKNAKGKKLAKMKYSDPEKYKLPAVSIKRQVVVDCLREAVAEKKITIHYEKKLRNIEQKSDGVTVFFEDGTTAFGDFLIAADGVNSSVRPFVSPAVRPDFTGIISQAGFISKHKLPGLSDTDFHNLNFVYGKNGFFGFSGANDKELMWWTNIKTANPWTREQLKNIDVNEEKLVLRKQYGTYAYPVSDIINLSDSYMRINVFDVQFLPNWFKDKIILIGDAAHAVSPNSGQGASMALEDAMLLAKLIRDEESHITAFSKFEEARRPRVEKIVLDGRKRGEDKLVVGKFQQFIRETMIRIFINLFGTKGNEWLFSYHIKW